MEFWVVHYPQWIASEGWFSVLVKALLERMIATTALTLADKLAGLNVKQASASNAVDQEMILKLVEEEEQRTHTTMDAFIRRSISATLKVAEDRFLQRASTLRRCWIPRRKLQRGQVRQRRGTDHHERTQKQELRTAARRRGNFYGRRACDLRARCVHTHSKRPEFHC